MRYHNYNNHNGSQPSIPPENTSSGWGHLHPLSILRKIQAGCTTKWRLIIHPRMHSSNLPTAEAVALTSSPTTLKRPFEKHPQHAFLSLTSHAHDDHVDHGLDDSAYARKQFKLARAVPAFSSPMTRVLSPVIKRAQWEIVVRSMLLALLATWVILGSLLAVPERRHH